MRVFSCWFVHNGALLVCHDWGDWYLLWDSSDAPSRRVCRFCGQYEEVTAPASPAPPP